MTLPHHKVDPDFSPIMMNDCTFNGASEFTPIMMKGCSLKRGSLALTTCWDSSSSQISNGTHLYNPPLTRFENGQFLVQLKKVWEKNAMVAES